MDMHFSNKKYVDLKLFTTRALGLDMHKVGVYWKFSGELMVKIKQFFLIKASILLPHAVDFPASP